MGTVLGRIPWVTLLGIAILAACAHETPAATDRICTPANYVFCRCKDRSEGTKLCNADGTGFAPCDNCLSGSPGDGFVEPDGEAADAAPEVDSAPPDSGPPPAEKPKA